MKLVNKLSIFLAFGLVWLSLPEKVWSQCVQSSDPRGSCSGGACLTESCEETCCFNGSGWDCTNNCDGECRNWWECGCSPSCGSPSCGQGDGCSGSCSNSVNTWGAWSACSPVTYTRTRSNPCTGASQTENCLGTISGTIFDATDYAICPGSMAGLGVTGAVTTATSTSITYNATTNTNGLYTISARSPDTYQLTVDPTEDFVTVPKLTCQGSSVTLAGQGGAATRNFGFLRIYGGWFQGVNGSMYGRTGIENTIHGTMPLADRHLILANAGGTDGLAYYKSGSLNLGNYPGVTVSETGYQAPSGYDDNPADYTYWKVKMATFDQTVWNGLGQPVYTGGPNNYEIYTYTGDVTINWSPAAGERVIYLINGNVTVSGNITVSTATPSFLMVAANGSITFNTSVTRVDGWWVGNSLNFPCVDTTPLDGICDETDVQFEGQGSFIGYNSITLSRDQNIVNNSQPAELFTYRPDLLVNAPEPLYVSKYIWRYQ